ncbi:MAG TPA: cytochrome b5-like heme/steroid binding domain-containing protein [Candidatus Gracilibacteria bacterium]|nr:cytochrome b5-like heme/steroid binding domain-containing protein [Candidatus Gracilibacteria bacterium]
MKRIVAVMLTTAFLAGCSQNVEAEPSVTPDQQSSEQSAIFTMEDIQAHDQNDDCYTTIEGKVYDITPFVLLHPGGEEEITRICGKDGTAMFAQQHGGDRRPENQLEAFYIGELAE